MPEPRPMNPMMQRMQEIKAKYGKELHEVTVVLDNCNQYPVEDIKELFRLNMAVMREGEAAVAPVLAKLSAMKKLPDAPQPVYLWPDGVLPTCTEYTDNSDYRYTQEPDFKPFMYEMLQPENVQPTGAVLLIPGGGMGPSSVNGGLGTGLDLMKFGYQCFVLHNRCNHNPWCGKEAGADVARAVRIVRRDAAKYRIDPNNIAVLGLSNGGITGEECVRWYSGEQTVQQHFPSYQPDALDEIYGAPDALICIYGPRHKGTDFDYAPVKYPPTFFAVGRLDGAMNNLNDVYPTLIEHGVPVEVHTFAGVPHGCAGHEFVNGVSQYPNWELWRPLADAFMQNLYKSQKK